MSLMSRLSLIFRGKANRVISGMENHGESLDLAYTDLQKQLGEARGGLVTIATQRKKLEMQVRELDQQYQERDSQARTAMAAGREDLAREALTLKAAKKAEAEGLLPQYEAVKSQEEEITTTVRSLEQAIARFKTQKETVKAQLAAGQATSKVTDSLTGINNKMSSAGNIMAAAQDRANTLSARGAAVSELVSSGALNDPSGKDRITRELEALHATTSVEDEMSALRAAVGSAPSPSAVEAPRGHIAPATSLLPESMRKA